MDDRVIKIKKPVGNLRGVVEAFKTFLRRLVSWRPRTAKTKPLHAGKQPRTLSARTGNSVIRIRVGSPHDKKADPSVDDSPRPSRSRAGQGQQHKRSRINLDAVTHICKACGGRFGDGDETSKCSRNPLHFVHARCTVIMKGRCPYCGGQLA